MNASQPSKPASPECKAWLSDGKFWCLLAVTIAIGLGARAFHYSLASLSDEQQYITFARQLTQEVDIPARPNWSSRIIWGWALNLWGRFDGVTLESSAGLMFLAAGVGIALTGALGKTVYGRAAGLMAAILVATFPIDVRYDVMTSPDGLAWPVLVGSVLLFFHYLQGGNRIVLAAAAFTAGLLIGIKEYYWFIIFCYIASLVSVPRFRADKTSWLILAGAFLAGVLPSFLLQYFATGDFLRQWRPMDTLMAQYDARDSRRGFTRELLSELGGRSKYFNWLLVDNGPLGLVLIVGLPYVALQAIKRPDCRTLFLAIAGFGTFLSLIPIRLSPLTFIEQQPRYALVMIPFLAVGAGGCIAAALGILRGSGNIVCSLAFALVVACVISLWLPNYAHSVRGVPAGVAVRECIDQAKELGATRVAFPWSYYRIIPTSYYDRGAKVEFAQLDKEDVTKEEYGRLDRFLETPGPLAVFVPLGMVTDPTIAALDETPGFRKEPVLAAGSSFRAWLCALGKAKPDFVAAYMYVRD